MYALEPYSHVLLSHSLIQSPNVFSSPMQSCRRKIRSKVPQKINIHLFFALLGLYSFFLIGVNRTDLGIGCVIFGVLIHFFCLASLAWMSVEATNMYLMFVKVFNAEVSQLLWKASAFAWGNMKCFHFKYKYYQRCVIAI